MDMGYLLEDIADGTLEVERVKRERAESLNNTQGWLGKIKVMDVVVSAATEASGRILGLARRSNDASFDQSSIDEEELSLLSERQRLLGSTVKSSSKFFHRTNPS